MAESKKESKEIVAQMSPSMRELLAFATELSKSQIVPLAYAARPSAIFAAIQYGKELGIPPMVALQNIAVINGKPSLGSDMLMGLAMKHPEFAGYEIKEETSKKAVVVISRYFSKLNKVISYTGSFSVEDAQRAGLLDRNKDGPWQKWLPNMLLHRAKALAVRKAFPDCFMGLYTIEELEPNRGAKEIEEELKQDDMIHVRVMGNEECVEPDTDKAPKTTSSKKTTKKN